MNIRALAIQLIGDDDEEISAILSYNDEIVRSLLLFIVFEAVRYEMSPWGKQKPQLTCGAN